MIEMIRNRFDKQSAKVMSNLAGFCIAVYPILAPYKLMGIYVTWILGAMLIGGHILVSRKKVFTPLKRDNAAIVVYTVLAFLLSLNGYTILNNTSSLSNSLIALFIELFIFMLAWFYSDMEQTMYYADILGMICCGYVIFQMIIQATGNPVPLGKLPFFEIATGWVPDVWGFRFNSLFSEPSYLAMYLLPMFIYHLLRDDWKRCLVFCSFIILSSSSFGIISVVVIIVWKVLWCELVVNKNKKYIKIASVSCIFFTLATVIIPRLGLLLSRSLEKIFGIFSQGENILHDVRILGYVEYFSEFPIKEKLLGTGISQLQNYFAERGVAIANYSNSFVLSLLNFGIVGFIIFILYLIEILRKSIQNHSFPFWIILFLAFAIDSLLFSYRYYWLLYFVWNYRERNRESV